MSSVGISTVARAVAYPDSEQRLVTLVGQLIKNEIPFCTLGRMSNVLFKNDVYDGVIIKTTKIKGKTRAENKITLACGESLCSAIAHMARFDMGGLEGLFGIPGSVGGMVRQNAGAFGYEIGERVLSVECYDIEKGEIITLLADNIRFSYRHSSFKNNGLVILSARFLFSQSDEFAVRNEMERCRKSRFLSQPIDKPSLGSTFKGSKEGIPASKLIDDCGLKGYSVGGAQISTKHAGFIINRGDATTKDYVDLSDYAADRVYEKYKIRLEREIEII